MKRPREIEILGGGLAGLSLGLALRRAGVGVVVKEAGGYPRHRVCGEFITALDRETKERLGLSVMLADARRCSEVAWFWGGRRLHRHRLPEPALAMGRHVLDKRLAEAFVEAGGDLRVGVRVKGTEAMEGRVFAHGRRASAGSPWLGLKCHVWGLSLEAELEVHLGVHGYVGLCELPGGRVNVSGLFRRRGGLAVERATALTAYLHAAGLGELGKRVAGAEVDPDSHCAVAGLAFGRVPRGEETERLCVGDAHALIPPFTGNGMTMAFQSAALAVDPLLGWVRGGCSWEETRRVIQAGMRKRFRTRLASAAGLHPFLLKPGGQRGLAMAAGAGCLPVNSLYRVLH